MKPDAYAEVFARVCAQLERGVGGSLRNATPNRQRLREANMRTLNHLYDVDWINGRAIEVFFCGRRLGARVRRAPRLVLFGRVIPGAYRTGTRSGRSRPATVPTVMR
jgi:hypothetical protein